MPRFVDKTRGFEWSQHNAARNYPFVKSASRASNSPSGWVIPPDWLIGVYLHIPWEHAVNSSRFWLREVVQTQQQIRLTFAYRNDADNPDVARAVLTPDNPPKMGVSAVKGVGQWERVVGTVIFGTDFLWSPDNFGVYAFDYDATALEPDAIRKQPPQVSGFQVGNALLGKQNTDIHLHGGNDVHLRLTEHASSYTLQFDAVRDTENPLECQCEDTPPPLLPIQTVNTVAPNSRGDITLNAGACTQVIGGDSQVEVTNNCSTPNCECEETNAMSQLLSMYALMLVTGLNRTRSAVDLLEAAKKRFEEDYEDEVDWPEVCEP